VPCIGCEGEVFVECTWIIVFSLVQAALQSKRRKVTVIRRISSNCTAAGVVGSTVQKACLSVSVCLYSRPASSGLCERPQAACCKRRIPHGYFYKGTCETAYRMVHWRVKCKCWRAKWRGDKKIYFCGPRTVCSSKVVMCDVLPLGNRTFLTLTRRRRSLF
jgi:hypothetical protein